MNFLKIYKKTLVNFGLILFTAVFMSCESEKATELPPEDTSPQKLEINLNANLQTMESFGASDAWQMNYVGQYWPISKRNQIADLLFSKEVDVDGNPKGIGLSLWRFNLGAGSAAQGDASGISDEWRRSECFTSDGISYDMNKQAGQVWFMKAARTRGVEKLLAFLNSPPVYLTINGKANATNKEFYNLKDNKMGDLGDFWVNSVDKLKSTHGLDIDYVSPFNEPQYNWIGANQEGSPATNATIYDFVSILSPKMIAKGLGAKIVVAEAGAYDYISKSSSGLESRTNQIDYFFGLNSSKNISGLSNVKKTVSAHSYFNCWPLQDLVNSRQAVASSVKTVPGLSAWSTEYAVLELPGTNELPDGGGSDRDLGIKTALWVARIISSDIAIGGVTSWQWWTAVSRADYKDGLLHIDNGISDGVAKGAGNDPSYCKNDGFIRETKTLWALGNFSFFVKPGMVRVAIPSIDNAKATKNVMLTAYKDEVNKKLVIVAVNIHSQTRKYKLNLAGATLLGNKLTPYTTSETLSLKKGIDVDATNFEIGARSIVTYVGTYE